MPGGPAGYDEGVSTSSDADPAVMWFRRDLRLADLPALHAAVAEGGPLLVKDSHSTRVTLVSYGLSALCWASQPLLLACAVLG